MVFAKAHSEFPSLSGSNSLGVLARLVPAVLSVGPTVASLFSRFTDEGSTVGALLIARCPLKSGHLTLLFLHGLHGRPGSWRQRRPSLMQRGHSTRSLGASVGALAFGRFAGRRSGSSALDSASSTSCLLFPLAVSDRRRGVGSLSDSTLMAVASSSSFHQAGMQGVWPFFEYHWL